MWQISYTESHSQSIPDAPVYHPEVEVFEVKEANGSHAGVLLP